MSLPAGVKDADVQASYKDGVLEVRVPKPEEPKPRRIEIGKDRTIEGTSARN